MTNIRKIAVSTALAIAAFLPVAQATTTSAPASGEEIVRLGQSFELGSKESLRLTHQHKPTRYRICVEDVPGTVPLKLNVDGKDMEVMDGTCTDVVGTHIIVRPSDKLGDGVLLGRYERVKQ